MAYRSSPWPVKTLVRGFLVARPVPVECPGVGSSNGSELPLAYCDSAPRASAGPGSLRLPRGRLAAHVDVGGHRRGCGGRAGRPPGGRWCRPRRGGWRRWCSAKCRRSASEERRAAAACAIATEYVQVEVSLDEHLRAVLASPAACRRVIRDLRERYDAGTLSDARWSPVAEELQRTRPHPRPTTRWGR